MATPIAVGGFEQGSTAGLVVGQTGNKYLDREVGTLVTNVDVSSVGARTGGAGLVLTASAGTAHGGFANTGNGGILGAAGTAVWSFWFRFPTLPGANAIIWQQIGTAGGNDAFLRYIQASNRLQAEMGASTQLGPVIAANTWYHVDILAVHDANPHVLRWRVNSAEQTDVKLAVATENIFIAGWGNDTGTQTSTVHVDDFLVSLTRADYPLGPHKVVQLIPDTTSTVLQIGTADVMGRMQTNTTVDATFNSADILAAISEVPPTTGGAASGVGQDTIATTSAADIPMTSYSLANEAITGCRINVCTWANSATAAANTLGVRAFNGLAETTLFAAAAYLGVNTASPAWICKMYTGVTDQQTLSNLSVRVGYSGAVTPLPGAHAVYAEVAVRTAEYSLKSTNRHVGVTPGPGVRFRADITDRLSYDVPVVASGPSGDGVVQQRPATAAAGQKTAAGNGAGVQRSATGSSGTKQTLNAAALAQRSSTVTAGARLATGGASLAQRSSTVSTSRKGGVGAGVVTDRSVTAAAGTKSAAGAGLAQQRSATQGIGTSSTVISGAGVSVQRASTTSTGTKSVTAPAAATCRVATAGTGVHGGRGAGSAQIRTTTTGAGVHRGAGTGQALTRFSTVTAGVRRTSGAGQVAQRTLVRGAGGKQAAGACSLRQRVVVDSAGAQIVPPTFGTAHAATGAVPVSAAAVGAAATSAGATSGTPSSSAASMTVPTSTGA